MIMGEEAVLKRSLRGTQLKYGSLQEGATGEHRYILAHSSERKSPSSNGLGATTDHA